MTTFKLINCGDYIMVLKELFMGACPKCRQKLLRGENDNMRSTENNDKKKFNYTVLQYCPHVYVMYGEYSPKYLQLTDDRHEDPCEEESTTNW